MIVGRLSHQCDIIFRVIDIMEIDGQSKAILYGEDYRLVADAPLEDLVPITQSERSKRSSKVRLLEEKSLKLFRQDIDLLRLEQEYKSTSGYLTEPNYFQIPGRVLHLDGDPSYLRKCLELYKKLGVTVYGFHCNEKDMPIHVGPLIEQYRPDVLVITGHDAYTKSKGKKTDINAYRHSKYFIEAVKEARKKVPHLDQLVIFAGACQSHFESLILSGANFASSPLRVNIHALDPVYIVAKISFTPFMERIRVWDVLRNTLTGDKGLGGVETKGVLRTGMPFKPVMDDDE
ncbi:sporulation peptidase YabG [Pseudogracilibacillus auburnensis]|uniref:sporulation peptidase YabG n=1 Tax=Pseudogracilibacillus auburnensis TaxID=1494959 RepID=UPI001A959D5E|nr:sporulation peptidase YabG [Pseudogracilibacillus auburnensis]MBO1004731.1 sporulation peptidase YabG [Pseudogracilibacillus auburnensis]